MACNPKLPLKATALRDLVDTVNQLEQRHDNALDELDQKIENDVSALEKNISDKIYPITGVSELIGTVTTSEDVYQINISTVNNEPINLESCSLKVTVPRVQGIADDNDKIVVSKFYVNDTEYLLLRNDQGKVLNGERTTIFGECKAEQGFWDAGTVMSQSYGSNPMFFASIPNMPFNSFRKYRKDQYPTIKKIQVGAITASYSIPAGTIIEIWGVRANA